MRGRHPCEEDGASEQPQASEVLTMPDDIIQHPIHPIKTLPPVEYLRERFSYDLETGELRWRAQPREAFVSLNAYKTWNSRYAGKIAGTIKPNGYRVVSFNHERHLHSRKIMWRAHRIIWKLLTGEEPPDSVDHRDRDPLNNKGLNLRSATGSQQCWNAERSKGISGYTGVARNGKGFLARIWHYGRVYYLGTFATAKEASAVYESTARKLRGEYHLTKEEGSEMQTDFVVIPTTTQED